jgi:ribosomal-protein-alanine N-acetyltransferase
MDRKVYMQNDVISLSEYIDSEDDINCYLCWQDKDTQNGYNYKMICSYEEFIKQEEKSRFIATIIRKSDNACIGCIFVSPEFASPDLAFMIFKPYRNMGYGTMAFSLGVKYCFEELKLDKIHAGCYMDNQASISMLKNCGFVPHPEGNSHEKHYLTRKDTVQLDFVKYNVNQI